MNRIDPRFWPRIDPTSQTPSLRIAALGLLGVVLICMVVILYTIQTPRWLLVTGLVLALSSGPIFLLGRHHARRLKPGAGGGNMESARSYN